MGFEPMPLASPGAYLTIEPPVLHGIFKQSLFAIDNSFDVTYDITYDTILTIPIIATLFIKIALFQYRTVSSVRYGISRDSRKSQKHGNHGNRDFRQML